MKPPLVIGLGSYHGDDQAGWLVLDHLRKRHFPAQNLICLRQPADLLDLTLVEQSLIICDACLANCQTGTVYHFSWPTNKLIYQRPFGSHDVSLNEVMELRIELGIHPKTAELWVMAGEVWSAGVPPSETLNAAAIQVAHAISEGRQNA